jgi:hypothetical protein
MSDQWRYDVMTLGFPRFAFSDEMKQIGTICKQTKVCIVKRLSPTPAAAALACPSGGGLRLHLTVVLVFKEGVNILDLCS